MADMEWREWIKTVDINQLRQSLETRKALLLSRYVSDKLEILKEVELLKAEIESRGK